MSSSVSTVPQNSATEAPGIFSRGDIFVVEESLLTPYHNLLAAAARTTPPLAEMVIDDLGSSVLPLQEAKAFLINHGCILWAPLTATTKQHFPRYSKTLPSLFEPCRAEEEGKFTIRTSPDWRTWPTTKTQWVVVIPMTPESGKFPVEPWMCFGDHNIPYTMEASEIEKLDAYSKEKLRDFSYKLVRDHAYLTKVAIALRDHEMKYLSQKKRQYTASRKSFGLQRLTQGVKLMRFTDTTNTVSDRISCKPPFSPKKALPLSIASHRHV
ncbi:hypothetical protein IW261DRAFT_1611329 [Armillaria novae-zelandiae]|uniref:Uncharacterized protein n=1 Tax=Armillaria novae-zelandiae TaxID=153914 RepID=A0AA39UBZ1_9AGAR|nr:hypothetical protein IW261DRAFT_1611329 [Armillaria novae-zelandiae]